MKYNIVIIVGPTACGKTSLSVELAQKLNTEIIGADSLQIYKDLNIGTAKVTKEEMCGITHHMIDIIEAGQSFSVSEYRDNAMPIIEEIIAKGNIPVVVGGTGFYIDALIGNNIYGQCPANTEIRQKYEVILAKDGKEHVYSILKQIDPETANKLHMNDVKRVIRAIEIYESTGKTKSELERMNSLMQSDSVLNPLIIGLNLSTRDKLYDRIDRRVDIMIEQGLEKEVRDLINGGLDRNSQSLQAIGYKEFFDYFDGKITKEELIANIKLNTRHYAKRQLTYFRHLNINKWFNTDELDNDEIVDEICKLLEE